MPEPTAPAEPAEPVAPAAAEPSAPVVPAVPSAPAVPTPPGAPDLSAAEKVDDLPAWAQKIITDARSGEANYRTKANAAEQQSQGILAAVAKAAGIEVPGEKPDPEALTAALAKSERAARDASIKLAVYQAAGATGGNPDALLDSNTFLASVSALDPTAADFNTKVGDAIKAALTTNPTLKAARAAGASTVETPGGTGEQGQITEAQLAQMTEEQIAEAYNKGLLKNLLA